VSSGYGPRKPPPGGGSSNHLGIDIRAPNGTPIFPAKGGTVIDVGDNTTGAGYFVQIDHGGTPRVVTRYLHMNGPPKVGIGDTVTGTTVLGGVGRTGTATGNHLHYEVKVDGQLVNPRPYLGR
jgi:murein DD-endopeptidase MepM/ murein hydrolase activator NlpD